MLCVNFFLIRNLDKISFFVSFDSLSLTNFIVTFRPSMDYDRIGPNPQVD